MKASTALALLAGCLSTNYCPAQSNLVISDADGDPIGVFEYVPDPTQSRFTVSTRDGYLMNIEPDGGLSGPALSGLYFTTTDCSGQGYVSIGGGGISWLAGRGGQIVQLGSRLTSSVFAKVEWFPETTNLSSRSRKFSPEDQCIESQLSPFSGVAATFVSDPSEYFIKQRDDQTWGFKLPLSTGVKRSEGIFCNGFEGCPQP